jgi:limonene-1,2-epoxide hydrolase
MASFPLEFQCYSVGKRVELASKVFLKQDSLEKYLQCMDSVLSDSIHYIDPVHELHGKPAVLEMLKKYVPRIKNEPFDFTLLHEDETQVLWSWVLNMKIRFTPFRFTIHGLVRAEIEKGKIVRQREYYDPMESIGVIPLVGFLYKLVLKMG